MSRSTINQILRAIGDYADKHPSQRFTQILTNLNINQFENQQDPSEHNFLYRDNYNDTDAEVIERIETEEE